MSDKFHIGEKGVSKCSAQPGNCPLGGEHFETQEAAQKHFEDNNENRKFKNLRKISEDKAKEFKERVYDSYERDEFFNRPDQLENYTLVDPETGSVFSTNSVVMEAPEDEDFYEQPEDFIDEDDKYDVRELSETKSLSEYKNPVIVEMDTGLIVDAKNIHAINHGKESVDFDLILESQKEAYYAAEEQGFKLWK